MTPSASSNAPTFMLNDGPADDIVKPPVKLYKYNENGIVPISNPPRNLGDLLREYCIGEGVDGEFWTTTLLRHILTKQRIRKELKKPRYKLKDSQVEEFVDKIHPSLANSSSKAYIKVFALLVLLKRPRVIKDFMDEEVDDQLLPIVIRHGYVFPLNRPERRLLCFDQLETHEREHFESNQWKIDTPYFGSTNKQPLTELTLQKKTYRPWRVVPHANFEPLEGAYATVIQVEIHPTAHSYEHLLEGINLDCATFAIKTLHRDAEQAFRNEWAMLKHFNGLNHPHLVTALSAFRQEGKLSFIFPYAPSDFERHKEKANPPRGRSGALWISAQLQGLIGAIDTMHNPKHLHLDPTTQRKYGRHGDIKCDNVLCFRKSGTSNEDILVISDFGLSAFNSDKSRSNIPNQKVPPVPGYRPPECDIEGGTISRSFDIWTIGCLFLELVTWFLGGPQYVRKFEERRTTPFINGSKNSIFFSFKDLESDTSDGAKAVLVKPEVTAWIHKLHRHPNCSPFLHDVLDVVEKEMLVVLSTDKQRSSSGDLLNAFVRISGRCKSDRYTRAKPWTDEQLQAAQNDITRNNIAVRAVPSENASALININQITLPIHRGRTTLSLSKDAYENMP